MKLNLFLLISSFISIQIFAQNFTIIALPDTQDYCEFPANNFIFGAQTQWIYDNKDNLNIVFVSGLGDCVQNAQLTDEWDIADAAYSIIETEVQPTYPDGIPYGLSVGNHDQFPKKTPGATANFNTYFGVNRFTGRSYYGGHYGTKNDNSFQLFSGGGMDFIIIHLEFDESTTPDPDVLDWADGLLTTYSGRRAIVTSHYILDRGNQAPFGDQGQAIFNKLKVHANLFLMLGGHVTNEGEREDTGTNGNTIYTLLSCYQDEPNGGNGWLRIMEFSPANDEIIVSTYSPTLDEYGTSTTMGLTSISAPFTLDYDMITALPVELIDFKVRKDGKESIITWETASEENNKGFEIQKSDDGESWGKLAWVEGLGTANISQSYSYVDTEPQRGTNYYRLRQIDNDNTETFSAVRVVTFSSALEIPIIYPNPVLDELTIEMPKTNAGKVTFEIKDILGRVLMTEKINLEDETYKINTNNLVLGIYYLNIYSKSSMVSYPFAKMN